MRHVTKGKTIFMRIDKDEDLFASILEVANNNAWSGAHISGIGALKEIELGFYNLPAQEYIRRKFPDNAELLALEGNLSFNQGKRFLHLHGVCSNSDFQCFGGHLFAAKVAVTCEVNIRLFDVKIERQPDHEIGLSLLNICQLKD